MIKAFILSWVIIFALALLLWIGTFHNYGPPTMLLSSRIAACLFLVCVIALGVAEFGWGGGDHNK